MKLSEMRLLSVEELKSKVADAHQELMNLRFQLVQGQLSDTNRYSYTRKEIARFETLIRERELSAK